MKVLNVSEVQKFYVPTTDNYSNNNNNNNNNDQQQTGRILVSLMLPLPSLLLLSSLLHPEGTAL